MCRPTTNNIEEEMNLLQKREDVERALMEYQRSYLSSEIFDEIKCSSIYNYPGKGLLPLNVISSLKSEISKFQFNIPLILN